MPRVSASATFSIDSGPAVPFLLPVYSEGFRGLGPSVPHGRLPILVTPLIANGPHVIEIVHLGSPSTVPLTIDFFIVAHEGAAVTPTTNIGISALQVNRTTVVPNALANSPSSYSHPPSSGLSAADTTQSPKTNTGAIVGGAVAGLFVALSLAFLCFWFIRRRKPKEPTYSAVPFSLTETSPAPTHPASRSLYSQPSDMAMENPHPYYSRYSSSTRDDQEASASPITQSARLSSAF